MGLCSKAAFKKESLRKVLHLPGLLFLYGGAYRPGISAGVLLSLALLYLVSGLLMKKKGRGIPPFDILTRALEREGKLDGGPVFLALGLALSLLFFDFRAACLGILQICIADGAAALAGMAWGRKRLFYSPKKSYLGTLTFFIVAFLIQLPFVPMEKSAWLAGAGALLESLPLGAFDNLLVPVAVSFLAGLIP